MERTEERKRMEKGRNRYFRRRGEMKIGRNASSSVQQ
jgi:hypothetical protein